MLDTLSTIWNVILMLLGFGLIIVVHEAGHFIAAKWAGIRVHAFAVGFGQAIFSWRKGIGFRSGSSEKEYLRLLRTEREGIQPKDVHAISPTEYRLNWFPFGGYVKMLGQEDLNPEATSVDPDSYTQKPVWKRMIVISGGVVMNVILAAALFIIAFSVGIMEIAPVIGTVVDGEPAMKAGLEEGDAIVAIDGKPARSFNDLFLATAMARRDDALTLRVQRPGESSPRDIEVTPEPGGSLGLLQIGVGPGHSDTLASEFESEADRQIAQRQLEALGLESVEPGMSLVHLEGPNIIAPGAPGAGAHHSWAQALKVAIKSGSGAPVRAVFSDHQGAELPATIHPSLELQFARAMTTPGAPALLFEHVLGLTPVMQVRDVTPVAERQGLRAGDVFARLGTIEWPSVPEARVEIQRFSRRSISAVVLRDSQLVDLELEVSSEGQVGFLIESGTRASPIIRSLPASATVDEDDADRRSPAQRLTPALVSGSRVISVAGESVESFAEVAQLIRANAISGSNAIPLEVEFRAGNVSVRERVELTLTESDVADLTQLSWHVNDLLGLFDVLQFEDRATDPINAIVLGVKKTHYVVMITYVTFARLVQGTVPVDQLHGPVGITHLGSRVADRGLVYLIFFLGLISANLAVINFLPLPIVDGGHFVFLLIEGITKKPVSVAVQNLATIAGLILIGTVFVVVTFNDIMRLVG